MKILERIVYKFEHVLCADFSMSYVNCSPNGLAVRLAASVQHPYVYIHCTYTPTLVLLQGGGGGGTPPPSEVPLKEHVLYLGPPHLYFFSEEGSPRPWRSWQLSPGLWKSTPLGAVGDLGGLWALGGRPYKYILKQMFLKN